MKNKAIFIEGYQDKKYRLIRRLIFCNPFVANVVRTRSRTRGYARRT